MTSSHFSNFTRLRWRWWSLALLGTMPGAALLAQDQLTSATLAAWNATGPAPQVASGQSTIILPAGGQLARTYPAGQLLVHVVSRPFFGATADNWPALEVGPASLTFVLSATGGGMVLLGDKALPLPSTIAVGSDGRSLQPLDLSLSYDNFLNQATLLLNGASYSVAATTSTSQLQVAVSAGGALGWSLDSLEVSSTPSPAGSTLSSGLVAGNSAISNAKADNTTTATTSSGSGVKIDAATRKLAFANAIALAASGDTAGAEKALAAVSHYPASSAGGELELASNLVQVVYRLREDGSLANAAKIAQLILQHLNNCVKVASTSEGDFAGSAMDLAGLVEDRFFGDLQSAEASYRKALTHSSGLTSAQSALHRLLAARNSEQQKLAAWGHK